MSIDKKIDDIHLEYEDIYKALPNDYEPLLNPKETQQAITKIKRFFEDKLCDLKWTPIQGQ